MDWPIRLSGPSSSALENGRRIVGGTKSYGVPTFATLDGAGHMVRRSNFFQMRISISSPTQGPDDKPEEALTLFNRWLADVPP
jgi:hypothetical protein